MKDKKTLIKEQVYILFTSRNIPINKNPEGMPQLPEIWYYDLKDFNENDIINAFRKERREGGQFPSLSNIIKNADKRPDPKQAAIQSWHNILNAIKISSRSDLTKLERKALDTVCINGLNDLFDANDFQFSQYEKKYKEEYARLISEYNTSNVKSIENNNKDLLT